MATHCTRCEGSGFLNLEQMPEASLHILNEEGILKWISDNEGHDVQVCDCCGDGEETWYGEVGQHYSNHDPQGPNGPYAYNGGLCECH